MDVKKNTLFIFNDLENENQTIQLLNHLLEYPHIHIILNHLSKKMKDQLSREVTHQSIKPYLKTQSNQDSHSIILISDQFIDYLPELNQLKEQGVPIIQTNSKIDKHFHTIPIESVAEFITSQGRIHPSLYLFNNQQQYIHTILNKILNKANMNFYQYKRNTIMRRIKKRMDTLNIINIADYVHHLDNHENELMTLSNSFFIGVTQFFRDQDAFNYLNQSIIPELFETEDKEIRIWIAGCSTGEEAYSLAILLHDYKQTHHSTKKITLFATDINKTAIETAKKGIYSHKIETDVSPSYLKHYFDKINNHYVVTQEIKNLVKFSVHNLIQDIPFHQLNMISCRNVFIYMNESLQKHLLAIFEFSLKENGYLFLGNSEVVNNDDVQFISLSEKYRIYQQGKELTSTPLINENKQVKSEITFEMNQQIRNKIKETEKFYQSLLNETAQSSIVINDKYELIHIFGQAKQFITSNRSTNLVKMLPAQLSTLLLPVFHKVMQKQVTEKLHDVLIRMNGKNKYYTITVSPLPSFNYQSMYLLLFTEEMIIKAPTQLVSYHYEDDNPGFITQLINDLNKTRDELFLLKSEYEATSEELQSTNEELISSNEELQSSNEELNSLNEELSSINNELYKLNQNYKYTVNELTNANDDIINLLKVSKISAIILDKELKIRRFADNTMNEFDLIDDIVGHSIKEIDHQFEELDLYENSKKTMKTLKTIRKEIRSKIGNPYVVLYNPYYSKGQIQGVVISLLDISELKQAYGRIERLNYIIENIKSAVITTDKNGIIGYVNPYFYHVTGYSNDEILGKNIQQFISDPAFLKTYETFDFKNSQDIIWKGEVKSTKKDGSPFYEQVTMIPIFDERNQFLYYLIVSEDITKKKEDEAYIKKLAYTDPLTHLANRTYFKNKMEEYLANIEDTKKKLAVLFMDLNSFKDINDSLGHNIGDLLLKKIAERINNIMQNNYVFSRFGGDEFILTIPYIQDENKAITFSEEIVNEMKKPFIIEGKDIYTSFSIGIVIYPDHGKTLDELLKNADIAMYTAKEKASNYELFNYAMHHCILDRLEMEKSIQEAIIKKEFLLYYQPIIDINTGKLTSVETLLRWQSQDKGLLAPNYFLDLIENSGQIITIGDQTMFDALNNIHTIQNELDENFKISFNLSTKQLLNPDLVENFIKFLEQTNVGPEQIMIEITESITAEDIKRTSPIFQKLNSLGVSFSMDDFGTGYSSLGQLKNYPIKKVKIDKLFVDKLDYDQDYQAILKGIIALAHSMNYKVVAEGIEKEYQLELLREYNCDEIQGYYICKPLPFHVLLDVIKNNKGYFF